MQYLTVVRNAAQKIFLCRNTREWLGCLQKLCAASVLLFCARNPFLRGAKSPWSQSSAAWWHDTPSQCHPSSSWTWSVQMMRWRRRRRCLWSTFQRVSCTISSAFLAGWWKMAGIKVGSAVSCSLVVLYQMSALPTTYHGWLGPEVGCWGMCVALHSLACGSHTFSHEPLLSCG